MTQLEKQKLERLATRLITEKRNELSQYTWREKTKQNFAENLPAPIKKIVETIKANDEESGSLREQARKMHWDIPSYGYAASISDSHPDMVKAAAKREADLKKVTALEHDTVVKIYAESEDMRDVLANLTKALEQL
jgi:hypothetical protein